MKTVTIRCDACGSHLSTTTNCEDWRIKVESEPKEVVGNCVTSMCVDKPIASTLHFCNIACLKAFFFAIK